MHTQLTGGYVSMRGKTIKVLHNPHTQALKRPVEGPALEALNWTQKTRWRINRGVLVAALQMRDQGLSAPGLPGPEDYPLPPRLPEHVFEAMTPDERKKHLRDIEAVRTRNAAQQGTRASVYRRLELARDLAQFPTLWFPHFLDFRGRLYPLPQDLHTQGDTLTKGLLEFAETVPLGANGQWWMYVACANAFGHDKLPLQERADWTDNNLTTILAAAKDPLAYLDFWATDAVDSPWEALAACLEVAQLADWIASGNRAETFEGRMPIRLDATCSGIQHLSAMMRDELSARCVNVLPTGKREDIYGDVSKSASAQCALDAANGNPMALKWMGRVTRSSVKRAVMTTPYGVTARGIVEQAVADGHCNFLESSERWEGAEYLKDLIVGALDSNIGAPRRAMKYFQEVARLLADDDIPLTWTTPSGFTVRQAYFKTDRVDLRTLAGRVILQKENQAAGLIGEKQRASAAPNVVHSYDAAHLSLTACAMKRDGVRDLAFVHDSFGTHAGNTDLLSRRVREQFVEMYQGPALEQWRESVVQHTGRDDIPPIPELGTLDVSKVLGSEFFFS